jgi:hypothetical protein
MRTKTVASMPAASVKSFSGMLSSPTSQPRRPSGTATAAAGAPTASALAPHSRRG